MSSGRGPLGQARDDGKPDDGAFDVDAIQDALLDRLPDLGRHVQNAQMAAVVCASAVLTDNNHAAVKLLVNQAVNDLTDLLFDLIAGRGRPATRAARALVEHAINLSTVASATDLADRYARHAAIRSQVEAEAQIGVQRLTGNHRRAEQHRLRKLARDAKVAADQAVADYGPSYRRAWANRNLRERARDHDLDDLYGYYRLSSMVLHGSAGGADGTVSDTYHSRVHRSGPDLMLCINAFHEGLRAYQVIAVLMEQATPVAPHEAVTTFLTELLDAWPEYRAAIQAVDEWLWPSEAPDGPMAVLCAFRSGLRRWYWFEPRFDIMVEAHPPQSLLDTSKFDNMIATGMKTLGPSDACVSITVTGVRVSPRFDRSAVPASSLLMPRQAARLLEHPLLVSEESV